MPAVQEGGDKERSLWCARREPHDDGISCPCGGHDRGDRMGKSKASRGDAGATTSPLPLYEADQETLTAAGQAVMTNLAELAEVKNSRGFVFHPETGEAVAPKSTGPDFFHARIAAIVREYVRSSQIEAPTTVSERQIISELKSLQTGTRGLCARLRAMLTDTYSAPYLAGLWLHAELPAAASIPQFLMLLEELEDRTRKASDRLSPKIGRPTGSEDSGLDQFVLRFLLCVDSYGGKLTLYKTQHTDEEWGGSLKSALELLWPYLAPSGRSLPLYSIYRVFSDYSKQRIRWKENGRPGTWRVNPAKKSAGSRRTASKSSRPQKT